MKKSKIFNWGILGTGKIAGKFASDLALIPNANLYAVGSRTLKSAKLFSETYFVENAYGSYEQLLEDQSLDLVYIATPNSCHFEHSLLAMNKGVHVLCEKPLAINARQVRKMIASSKAQNVFLMEALWTMFLPHFLKIKDIISEGIIGEVQSVRADFGFLASFDPNHRLFNPALGGGALLDIGIYPLLLSQAFLGVPDNIKAVGILGQTKVDEEISITMTYQNQKIAHLHASLRSITPVDAHIYGTKGYVYIPNRWHKPVPYILVYDYASATETKLPIPNTGLGYNYEAEAVMKCLEEGLIENQVVSSAFSLKLMETMDEIRRQIGVHFLVD